MISWWSFILWKYFAFRCNFTSSLILHWLACRWFGGQETLPSLSTSLFTGNLFLLCPAAYRTMCHWKCRQCQTKWGFPFCRFCVVAKHLPTVHATLNPFIYWSQLLTSQIILFRRIFNSTLNTCCITSSAYHLQLWVQILRKQWQLHIVTLSSDENLFSTCPDRSWPEK